MKYLLFSRNGVFEVRCAALYEALQKKDSLQIVGTTLGAAVRFSSLTSSRQPSMNEASPLEAWATAFPRHAVMMDRRSRATPSHLTRATMHRLSIDLGHDGRALKRARPDRRTTLKPQTLCDL